MSSIDKNIKKLYTLILNKGAEVTHCIEYKQHYEIHLEWEVEETSFAGYFDDKIPPYWTQAIVVAVIK